MNPLHRPRLHASFAAAAAVAALALLAGCAARAEELPYVDLSERLPVPGAASVDVTPLRIAFAAVISPRGTVEGYQPLVDYLSGRLGRPGELVQRRTYAEVNDLLRRGEVDIAFVCTSAYVIGHREFGLELLAAPRIEGEITYRSLLVVPAGSPARSMADLRSLVFAFTDPWSTSGRLAPTARVRELGSTPEAFFRKVIYTYSHDDAIRAVASGVADGAAVDSVVYGFALERDPDLASRVKVIERSEPFGMPPVVTGPELRPQVRAEIASVLLGMDEDPSGRDVLAAVGIDRFETVADEAYASVRALEAAVGVRSAP